MCFHKWLEWSGQCDDWGGMYKAEVCVKCWTQRQQDYWGKWHEYPICDSVTRLHIERFLKDNKL